MVSRPLRCLECHSVRATLHLAKRRGFPSFPRRFEAEENLRCPRIPEAGDARGNPGHAYFFKTGLDWRGQQVWSSEQRHDQLGSSSAPAYSTPSRRYVMLPIERPAFLPARLSARSDRSGDRTVELPFAAVVVRVLEPQGWVLMGNGRCSPVAVADAEKIRGRNQRSISRSMVFLMTVLTWR